MDLVLASTAALFAGPVILRLLGRRPWVASVMDAYVLMVIGGVVFLHILPEGVVHGGWMALPAAAVGLLIPTLGERLLRPAYRRVHAVVFLLGLLALGLHAFVDGINLHHLTPFPGPPGAEEGPLAASGDGSGHAGHDHAAGHDAPPGQPGDGGTQRAGPPPPRATHAARVTGVLVHRIPVGVAIWWLVRGPLGLLGALCTVLAMSGVTAGGYLFAGSQLGAAATDTTSALLQALFAGSLLHVVLHRHDHPPSELEARHERIASGLGGLAGLATVLVIGELGTHQHLTPGPGPVDTFLRLALASAPALLLAYLVVGFAHVLVPRRWLQFLQHGSHLSQAGRGVFLGLPLPVCSCGVIPVYRELVLKGVPLAAAIAFLVATPELELAAALMSFELLGTEVALARLGSAAALALVTAVIIGKLGSRRMPPPTSESDDRDVGEESGLVGRGIRFGFGEVVDHTAPWILVGLLFAAILEPFLRPEWFAGLSHWVDVPLLAVLGFPLYVCASGSTPLAALLLMKGLSPGAALAFLLTGPATNVTTLGVLGRLHGMKVAAGFAATAFGLAVAFGYVVNMALPGPVEVPQKVLQEAAGGFLQVASAVVLAFVFLASFLRQGARGFMDRIKTYSITGDRCASQPAGGEPGAACH